MAQKNIIGIKQINIDKYMLKVEAVPSDDVGHMRLAHASEIDMLVLQICLQEQRKQSFLALAKENQSPLGLYRNPLSFFFTNPQFVLLTHDRHFVLFSLRVCH